MNSVKNLFVVVMLMGVSYGAIQVINTPDPTLQNEQMADAEGIDLQMGSRNHDSLGLPAPPLQSGSSSVEKDSGTLAEPGFPPLPSNLHRKAPSSNPPSIASREQPKLSVPPLEVPDLQVPKLTAHSVQPNQLENNGANSFTGSLAPETTLPPVSAPPVTEPPARTADIEKQNSFATANTGFESAPSSSFSNGGSFGGGGSFAGTPTSNPEVETQMKPVQPKPESTTIPKNQFIESTNQLVENANQFSQEIRNGAEAKAQQFSRQVNQSIDPVRDAIGETINNASGDAAKLLEESKAGLLDRANEFTRKADATKDNVANLVADTLSPVHQPAADYLPSKEASPNIDWNGINQIASGGEAKRALSTLSKHYSANLTESQRLQMLEWLDVLAGKVIYSTEHHLQSTPYVVKQNDTLETLADRWQVPSRLIYMINQGKISDPALLVPGTELKVVQGPFNAMVSTDQQELTLFLGDMYAGRFPIEMGTDGEGLPHGTFRIREKSNGKVYQLNGQRLAAGAANNPYGKFWMGLGEGLGIHEFDSTRFPATDRRGSIRVSSQDAADIYGILSNGSEVTITR